jgi:hypothetical protein
VARRLVKRRRARDVTGGTCLRSNVSGFGVSLSAAYPAVSALGQAHSVMNRLSCNQCSLRTLHGNDADPVDPTQMPGWQTASLVAAGSRLLPPLLAQADRAEPSRMSAQTPITAGTLIMMLASPWGCVAVGPVGMGAPALPRNSKGGRQMRPWIRRISSIAGAILVIGAAGTSETSDGDRDEDPTTLPWYDHRDRPDAPLSDATGPA